MLLRSFTLNILLFLVLFPALADESSYILRHYQVKDGLSDNLVTCFLQDKHGFMWIGTRDGLNKFDGYNFKVYRNEDIDSNSQRYNRINYITLDQKGEIWISMRIGLFRYDEDADAFELVPSTQNKNIGFCQFDSENKLWRLESGSLIQHDITKDTYRTFSRGGSLRYTAFCLKSDSIWVADSQGYLSLLNREDGTLTSYDMFPHIPADISRRIRQLYPSKYSTDIYLACESDYLKVFNSTTSTHVDLEIQNAKDVPILINCILETHPDEIWVGTDRGIYIYGKDTGKWTKILPNPLNPYTISSHYVAELYKDRENGIWIGYHQNGLSYYSPFHPFDIYYPRNDSKSIKGGIVHDICADDNGTLWVATEDAGLSSFDRTTGVFSNYGSGSGKYSIAHTNIRGLVFTKDKLWVGHIIHGIDLLDIRTGKKLKNYRLYKDSATRINSRIYTMQVLKNGDLLTTTSDGIYKYDVPSDKFIFVSNQSGILREDNRKRLWGGRYYFELDNEGTPVFVPHRLEMPQLDTLLNQNAISDVYTDNNGDVWFATEGNGIIKYSVEKGQLSLFTTKNGMPSNITFRILPDDRGNLWISTAGGLVCLDTSDNSITTYTEAHGLISRQFNYFAGFKDSDGSLYFGTVKGLVHFKPENLKPDNTATKVFITAVNIAEKENRTKSLPVDTLSGTNQIVLEYDQSTFHINLSTLSYIAPGSTKYYYRLSGLNKEWNIAGERNSIYFTDLNPGKYTLEIKASDITGNWANSIPLFLYIVVNPPWWSSNTAYIIYLLCILGIIYMSVRLWLVRQKKSMAFEMQLFENEKERELYQAKIDFFINIAHEIRTPLTLIKIPLEKVIKRGETGEEDQKSLVLMNKNVSRLIELVNQLLDFRKAETEGMRLTVANIELTSLLDATGDRFRDFANEKGITICLEFSVQELDISVDKEAFTKVLSNLFSNAIKYASTQVTVSLYVSDSDNNQSFTIEFANDGSPVSPEEREKIFAPFYRMKEHDTKPGSGLGLSLARFLVEKHHGTIKITESNQERTVFSITVPVRQPGFIEPLQITSSPVVPIVQDYPYEVNRASILIVDDENEIRSLISAELSNKYNVLCARNGGEALQILEDTNVQLVISDILMPVMDGLALLKEIKTDIKFSHVPVILLTAKTTMQAKLEGLELGADAYMEKPFSMDMMLVQISNLLTNRENVRQFYFKSPIANMKSMAYSKADGEFLEKLNAIINEHLSDPDFDVNTIADVLHVSRPTLYRKIRAISHLTPHDLIKIARLKRAAELLIQGDLKIYEIAELVGFNSQSNFWSAFTKQFGMTPSKYAKVNHPE